MNKPALPAGLAALCALAIAACGEGEPPPPPPDAGPELGVRALFELAPDPMPYGAIPFPDDLYLDEEGRVAIGLLPGEERVAESAYHDSLRVGLGDLDGFGAVTPAYFYFDGDLDPESLPASPEVSLLEDASVFLVDVDPASATGFTRLPIEVDFEADAGQLALRPANGHPLRSGGRYAAVVTTAVRGADGHAIRPAETFAALRDALTRPDDDLLGEAYDHYSEVLATLTTNGVSRESIAALALFRVQTITDDLRDARDLVWEGDAPVVSVDVAASEGAPLDALLGDPVDLHGLDVEGGVRHDAIGWMIHGSFPSSWLLSSVPNVHGRFTRDADGLLVVHDAVEVPFTAFLPRGDLSELPVAIFQHGLGAERSNALAFADALCAEGYAVVAMDLPWHGMRNPSEEVDTENRFSGEAVPDGFGDERGLGVVIEFAGITDGLGELAAFHPNYLRDALRQGVVDQYALVRTLREGDWSAVRETDPALSEMAFSAAPIALIGYSLGGIVSTQLAALEPEIGVSVLAVTGGSLMHIVSESPTFNRGYYPLLLPKLGLDAPSIDYETYHPRFMPELAIWQTLLDRGDSIAYARTLASREISILMPMARHDETLNNVGTESLARAISAEMIGDMPLHTDMAVVEPPLRDNVSVDGEMVTRAVYVWSPASHGLMLDRVGSTSFAHPVEAPFTNVEEMPLDNPIDDALSQTVHFLQSFRTGTAEVVGPR